MPCEMPCELATIYRDVEEISKEWENNITRLNYLEYKYFEGKKIYDEKAQEIIDNTDFKSLYGKNNETVRKNHVKKELIELYNNIHNVEHEINHLKRRISFLKAMTYVKINEVDH